METYENNYPKPKFNLLDEVYPIIEAKKGKMERGLVIGVMYRVNSPTIYIEYLVSGIYNNSSINESLLLTRAEASVIAKEKLETDFINGMKQFSI